MLHQSDGTVLVLAPFARDSQSIVDVLASQNVASSGVNSLRALADAMGEDTGAVILTEEALSQPDWSALIEVVRHQPNWSSYPFLLLVGHRRGVGQTEAAYSMLPPEITNVMVLERPMGISSLTSAVRWALTGRERQFLTRNHLAQLEESARRQQIMTRELAHRVKNTIAVLQSIVSQTMRPFPEMTDVKDLVLERFSALARAHDLLLGTDFTAADFHQLIDLTLSVHPGNYRIDGPSISLSPQSSLSFALVLHELATNSLKYGALKQGRGLVTINWSVDDSTEPVLSFSWLESGVDAVNPPSAIGFGTRLIKSTLAGLGQASLEYPATGFELRFTGELARLTYVAPQEFRLSSNALE